MLEIGSDCQRDYDQHDIDFLTGFANVLAEAVATSERTSVLQSTVEQMKVLVGDKDRLLDKKMSWPKSCSIGCATICNSSTEC